MIQTALASPISNKAGHRNSTAREESSPPEDTVTTGAQEEQKIPTFAEMLAVVGPGEGKTLDLEGLGEPKNVDIMVEMENMIQLQREAQVEAWLERLRAQQDEMNRIWRY